MIELISEIDYNYTKSLMNGGILEVFIDNSCQNKSFLRGLISKVDNMLDIDFVITKNVTDAEIIFKEKKTVKYNGVSYTGFASPNNDAWELTIKKYQTKEYKSHVYVHEFGHALGLEHPFDNSDGDIWESTTTKDTIMSYNYIPVKKQFFTKSDIDTLTGLWNV